MSETTINTHNPQPNMTLQRNAKDKPMTIMAEMSLRFGFRLSQKDSLKVCLCVRQPNGAKI